MELKLNFNMDLKVSRKIFFLTSLIILMFSCEEDNDRIKKKIEHSFNGLTFETNNNWVEFKKSDNLIVFAKKDSAHAYVPNFTIIIYGDNNSKNTLDSIAKTNIQNLASMFKVVEVIDLETIKINEIAGRRVSYMAITNDDDEIGCMLYILKKNDTLVISSFSASNLNGVYKDYLIELDQIASSINF